MCFAPVVLAALQKPDFGAESEAEGEGRSEVWCGRGRPRSRSWKLIGAALLRSHPAFLFLGLLLSEFRSLCPFCHLPLPLAEQCAQL